MARYVVKEITRKEVEVLIALGIGWTDGWCRSFATSPLIVGTAIPQWPQKEMHIHNVVPPDDDCWFRYYLLSPNPPEGSTSESAPD